MRYTLLDMVQEILSSMDSDEVNSIGDTTESMQVARIIRTAYFNIIARSNLPEHNGLFSLLSSVDPDSPTLMYRPENAARLEWIKYDKRAEETDSPFYDYVTILPLDQFFDIIHKLNPDQSNVGSMVVNQYTFFFTDDHAPTYCTVLDDDMVIFDSYDSTMDGTLQESKTLCYGRTHPTFSLEDTFTPSLDDQQFPLLLNEAKSLAFLELKQMSHEKAEQESRRQWRSLQKTKSLEKLSDFSKLPNFGRK